MQHHPGSPQTLAVPPVDPFADERVPCLGQMNADLMLATGFQATGDQTGRSLPRWQSLENSEAPNVGQGPLGSLGGPAPSPGATLPITTIRHQPRLIGAGRRVLSSGQCQVTAVQGVAAKLLSQGGSGQFGARHHQKPRGFAVQALHNEEAPQLCLRCLQQAGFAGLRRSSGTSRPGRIAMVSGDKGGGHQASGL